MYKIDRRGGRGGSKNRSIGQTPYINYVKVFFKLGNVLQIECKYSRISIF